MIEQRKRARFVFTGIFRKNKALTRHVRMPMPLVLLSTFLLQAQIAYGGPLGVFPLKAPQLDAGQFSSSSGPSRVDVPSSTPNLPPLPTPNPIVVPTDVQSTLKVFPGNTSGPQGKQKGDALSGIISLPDSAFPGETELSGPISGITVFWKKDTDYKMINDYIVSFTNGEVLVSVKSPSHMALIRTPYGDISVGGGDVLAFMGGGIMRVMNLDGEGEAIKVQLNRGPFEGKAVDPTVSIAAGYELVASDKTLTGAVLRPRDGVARRQFKVIGNGRLAICEISVESVLKANDIIADIRQASSGVKERRIMGDLSKTASILNYKNGTQGFTVEE